MQPSTPFIDRESGTLDVVQILEEAVPVGKLIGLFVAVAIVPLLFALLTGGAFGGLMMLVAQFVLAIGSALTLMYVIVRGLQLAEEQRSRTSQRPTSGPSTAGEPGGSEGDEADESADSETDDVSDVEADTTDEGTADGDAATEAGAGEETADGDVATEDGADGSADDGTDEDDA